jgi:NAD(P)-dependent dehydrogenase (short-subunit alcohol dehydrogenase family)
MSRLSNKVTVVTGGSKGIGAEIARELAGAGASVVVNYATSREGADKLVAEIIGNGGKAVAIQGDVAKAADVERLFAETKRVFGPIDVLVNNAGVYRFGSLASISEAEFHRHFDTNVLGVLLATREAVKHFGPRRWQHHQSRFVHQPRGASRECHLRRDQERRRCDHPRAGQGARPEEDPGELDQSGRRGNRRHPFGGDHRQRF